MALLNDSAPGARACEEAEEGGAPREARRQEAPPEARAREARATSEAMAVEAGNPESVNNPELPCGNRDGSSCQMVWKSVSEVCSVRLAERRYYRYRDPAPEGRSPTGATRSGVSTLVGDRTSERHSPARCMRSTGHVQVPRVWVSPRREADTSSPHANSLLGYCTSRFARVRT